MEKKMLKCNGMGGKGRAGQGRVELGRAGKGRAGAVTVTRLIKL